jgi:hypothetical protein
MDMSMNSRTNERALILAAFAFLTASLGFGLSPMLSVPQPAAAQSNNGNGGDPDPEAGACDVPFDKGPRGTCIAQADLLPGSCDTDNGEVQIPSYDLCGIISHEVGGLSQTNEEICQALASEGQVGVPTADDTCTIFDVVGVIPSGEFTCEAIGGTLEGHECVQPRGEREPEPGDNEVEIEEGDD